MARSHGVSAGAGALDSWGRRSWREKPVLTCLKRCEFKSNEGSAAKLLKNEDEKRAGPSRRFSNFCTAGWLITDLESCWVAAPDFAITCIKIKSCKSHSLEIVLSKC